MAEAYPAFTPVNLITGFLGSGKTTLLQRLLADPALADTAVLINEFGEIGLDHHLLERIDERTVLLQSGCLCCTIRGELADAIRDLHARRERGAIPPFRRLVIESTGLADPFPILSTLHAERVLKHHFRIGAIITTVDAVNAAGQLLSQPEALKQIAAADRIVITKSDLAGAGATGALRAELGRINPVATLVDAQAPQLDAAALLGVAADGAHAAQSHWLGAAGLFADDAHAGHGHGALAYHNRSRHGDIVSIAMAFDAPLNWTAFGVWLTLLLHRHGEAVLRVKGILAVEGSDTPVAIHGVQHLVHAPVHMRAWPPGCEGQSRLVFIMRGIEPDALRRSMRAFGVVRDDAETA